MFYKRITIFLSAFVLGLFICSPILAADLKYGNTLDFSDKEALVEIRTIEKRQNYLCSLTDFTCKEENQKTNLLPTGFSTSRVFYNSDRSQAIAEIEIDATGLYAVSLYSNNNGQMKFVRNLELKNGIYRAFWTADNNRVLFLTRRENLALYDLAKDVIVGQTPIGEESYTRLTASPNGQYLAYYIPATLTRGERTFGIINVITGKKYKNISKVAYWDLLSEANKIFDFSSDSKKLYYLDDINDAQTLYQVNLKNLSGTKFSGARIITKNYSVADFSAFGVDSIFFSANRENALNWSLYKYNIASGVLKKIDDNISYGDNLKKTGDYLVYLKTESGNVNPIFYDTKNDKQNNLSINSAGNITPTAEVVKIGNLSASLWKSNIPSKKVLIWLHGGPFRQTSLTNHSYFSYGVYDKVLSEANSAGVNVLKLDYSGSFGYGRIFAESLKLNVGKKDVADVLAAYNYAVKTLGANEVYLMGNSYGGYLALKGLVEYPDKFAGAFSINGVTDWRILIDRVENSIFSVHFNGIYSSKTKKYYDQADIIQKIKNLGNQKVVVVYGEDDGTIPSDQAQIFYENLETSGKNAELVKYPEEEHILLKKETLEDLSRRLKSFLGI